MLGPARERELVGRVDFRSTPHDGSWRIIAEKEVSAMRRQCLSGLCIGDPETLGAEIAAWSTDVNARQLAVDWRMKIGDAHRRLKGDYTRNLS